MRGGFAFVQGGLTFKFEKIPLTYSVSYFKLGSLELCLGVLSPPKTPMVTGSKYTTVRWPDILRNVIVSGYVT